LEVDPAEAARCFGQALIECSEGLEIGFDSAAKPPVLGSGDFLVGSDFQRLEVLFSIRAALRS
jgi:hypothetical protein